MKHHKNFKEFLNEKAQTLNEASPKWSTANLDTEEFYNIWAALDVATNNLSHYMEDMNKGKEQDALYSLKVAYDELTDLLKTKSIEKQLKAIEAELKDKNVLR